MKKPIFCVIITETEFANDCVKMGLGKGEGVFGKSYRVSGLKFQIGVDRQG